MNSGISKCCGRDCPIKESCIRFTTPANPNKNFQSYIASPGNFDEQGVYSCEMLWPMATMEEIMNQLKDIIEGGES